MNNKGFTLQDLLFFISFFLIILVICVIVIDRNFMNINSEVDDIKHVSEVKKLENVEIIEDKNKEESKEDNKKITGYDILLEKMVSTAKVYVTTNYTGKTDRIIIKTSKLVSDEYMEDLYDPKDKENKCIGYIVYDGNNTYSPYLRCGENYKSENYDESFE
ncbi:MAG: hypothetical protein J6G98_04375 [Bacilli bacterium]|nr:hypothetical protein [Bacilli bacterium]